MYILLFKLKIYKQKYLLFKLYFTEMIISLKLFFFIFFLSIQMFLQTHVV